MLANEGIKVGLIRPKSLWPFPVNAFKEIDFNTTKHIISVELSQGQMIYDVKLAVECKLPSASSTASVVCCWIPRRSLTGPRRLWR